MVNSERFIDALRQLEAHGTVEPLVHLYGDDATLWNPELDQALVGKEGARRFWERYRSSFETIESDFRAIIEGDGKAALEWESHGQLSVNQQPFLYRGVSILEWSDDQITRFFAYFAPQDLTR